jgi:hypothetical protein
MICILWTSHGHCFGLELPTYFSATESVHSLSRSDLIDRHSRMWIRLLMGWDDSLRYRFRQTIYHLTARSALFKCDALEWIHRDVEQIAWTIVALTLLVSLLVSSSSSSRPRRLGVVVFSGFLSMILLALFHRVYPESAAWCRVCKHYAQKYDEWDLCR